MGKIKSFFGRKIVQRLIGAALIIALLWFVGPLIAIAGFAPLANFWVRLAIAVLILAGVAALFVLERQKARQEGGAIVKDLAAQRAEAGIAEVSAKFDAAIEKLGGKDAGAKLYGLPWYVIIGPPGGGKTTALQNSGLDFVDDGGGDATVAGIGGTRNCEWMFAQEAVLIDTAGRFTTQDSDKEADAREWLGFLDILRKRRPRQPLNGVLVAIPASTFVAMRPEERAQQARLVRARLKELHDRLGVRLPVYMLLTKADKLQGFSDYFAELTPLERKQVLGFTFSREASEGGQAIASLVPELTALGQSVAERYNARLADEIDPARRVRISAFLQEFANLEEPAQELVSKVFRPDAYTTAPLFRGFYLTSATQDGSSFDRVMSAMMSGSGASLPVSPTGAPKVYFLEELLHRTVLAEAGMAGTNPKAEKRELQTKLVGVAAAGLLMAVMAATWGLSWRKNASMIAALEEQTTAFAQAVPSGAADVAEMVALLDELRALRFSRTADEGLRTSGFGLGLGQTGALRPRVEGAYEKALQEVLLPLVMDDLGADVARWASDPAAQYEVLRHYLVAGSVCPVTDGSRQALAGWVNSGWPERYPGAANSILRDRLALHTSSLFGGDDTGRAAAALLDGTLVDRARGNIASLPPAARLYAVLKAEAAAEEGPPRTMASLAGENVRIAFAPSAEQVPAFFSRQYQQTKLKERIRQVIDNSRSDTCVLGEGMAPDGGMSPGALEAAIYDRYLSDFVSSWNDFLSTLTRPAVEGEAVTEQIRTVTRIGQVSPVRSLASEVASLTDLSPEEKDPDSVEAVATTALAQRSRSVRQLANRAGAGAQLSPTERLAISAFASWRQALSGEAGQAPLDTVLAALSAYGELIEESEVAPPSQRQEAANKLRAAGRRLTALSQDLPEPLAAWFGSYVSAGRSVAAATGKAALAEAFDGEVAGDCQTRIAGKFPLRRNARQEIGLGDFSGYFGPSGVLAQYAEENLAPYVDQSGRVWKLTTEGEELGIDPRMIGSFQAAQEVQEAFFSAGSPGVNFVLTPISVEGAVEARLDLSGETLTYANGAARGIRMSWPGATQGANITFTTASGQTRGRSWQGDWALFRMLSDATRTKSQGRNAEYALTVNDATFRFSLGADSVVNPFTSRAVNQVSCAGPSAGQ